MSDERTELLGRLEDSGFFEQVGTLQESLGQLSEDIATIGDRATQRLDEMESMAAHIMAIESVLAVMLKTHPVSADDVKAMVAARTGALTGDDEGSPAVQAVAQDIIGG